MTDKDAELLSYGANAVHGEVAKFPVSTVVGALCRVVLELIRDREK